MRVFLLTVLLLPNPVAAQQPLTTGIVFNTIEASSITHDCKPVDKSYSILECGMTQTSVRRKLSNEDAIKRVSEARAEYLSKPTTLSQSECKEYETLNLVLQGKKQAPDGAAFAKMTERDKADALSMVGQMVNFCRSPSLDAWLKVIVSGNEKDKRTCTVSSNHFTQRFKRSDNNSWIVIAQAEGPCGVVNLSRFEADKTSSGLTFWNYFSRKAVTNPSGDLGVMSCRMLDEKEYKYEWRKRSIDLSCEYVELSIL